MTNIKNELTDYLCYLLAPNIYDGIKSIYNSIPHSNSQILKTFQKLLDEIEKWNNTMLSNEVNRIENNINLFIFNNDNVIKNLNQSNDFLLNLIKGVFKSNIELYNIHTNEIDSFYNTIDLNKFIHDIYIMTSRNIKEIPYIMYHDFNKIELIKNKKDCINLIKEYIKDTIKKLLPINTILLEYIKNNNQPPKIESDINNKILNIINKTETKMTETDNNLLNKLKKSENNITEIKLNNNDIFKKSNSSENNKQKINSSDNDNKMISKNKDIDIKINNLMKDLDKMVSDDEETTVLLDKNKNKNNSIMFSNDMEFNNNNNNNNTNTNKNLSKYLIF
jgi:hypothetical protein